MSSKRSPFVSDPLIASLVQAQQRHTLFPPPAARRHPVVVAVSGGIDSITLLHILVRIQVKWHLELHIAHVDHALRPDSAADAEFVRALAAQWRLPFHTTRLDAAALHAAPAGLEAAARHARYRFLCTISFNVAPAPMVPTLVTAHHADDQAETVLLRLVQGGGLHGLAAMRPISAIDDPALTPQPVRVVRPLLAVPRAEIAAYARRHGLTWREDASNCDETRPRNLLRRQVLPLLARINPQVVATLGRTADLLAEEADRLASYDAALLEQCSVQQDHDRIVLRLATLQQMSAVEVRSVLHRALAQLHSDLREIGSQQIAALAASVTAAVRRSGPHPLARGLAWSIVALPDAGLALALHRRHVLPMQPSTPWFDIVNQPVAALAVPGVGWVALGGWRLECAVIDRADLPHDWQCNSDRWTAYFDASAIDSRAATAATLAPPRPGARIDPLGMDGRRKALGDLFTDARIDPALRRGWPVLYAQDGRVLWVCGLVQSHAARITDATQAVWVLRWRKHTSEGAPER